ncbi:synaptobrevin-domain-containing protein [Umbelopsis sp. AD052]|nr:synaptobrevin-domain-containing protein [Umbelopsis sp. AD052]
MSEPYDPYVPTTGNPPSATNAKTTKVRQEVDQVINIMQDNIDRVVDRGANLAQLQSKTDDLQATSGQFKRSANQVRKRMYV